MLHGEAAHVHLVDHHVLARDVRRPVRAPGEGGLQHAALGHEGGAVAAVEGQVLALAADGVAIERVAPAQLADRILGIGVDQQLVRIEAVAFLGLVGAVDAIAVGHAGARLRQVAVPDVLGALAQHDALQLAAAVVVEQAELDLLGVLGEQREVDAFAIPGRAARVGLSRPDDLDRIGALHARGPDIVVTAAFRRTGRAAGRAPDRGRRP